jgi:hypothetical protein
VAIPGQTIGTYNYNTLTRINDGTAFEFNTNATVLFVDELPSGVTLNASFESPSNPQILLREKVQLRFKATNRIIFTPSASTAGTIRIFLFFDESNPDEFDMSFFSTEVVGQSDVNITQINSSSVFAEDFGETFEAINPQSNQLYFAWEVGTASNVNVFTVPANREYYMQYIQYNALTGNSGITTDSRITSLDSGGSTKFQFARILATQAPTTIGAPITSTFTPTPVRFTAGEILQVQSQTTNFNISGSCYVTEVVV